MILDERGEPSINTQVRAMRYTMMNGRRRASRSGGGQTDDRGIYRLHSLQPGDTRSARSRRTCGPMNDAQRIQMETESLRRSHRERSVGGRSTADGRAAGAAAGAAG